MKINKLSLLFMFVLTPLVITIGVVLFEDRKYVFISLIVASLALISFIIRFEKNNADVRYLITIAFLAALTVAGRFLFAAIPAFKPVTAIVIITAIYFGSEAGFLVGALAALVSNMYFGQGPWTPFQMLSWGMIGFICGLPYLRYLLEKHKVYLALAGILAGILFSLVMDIWTVVSIDGTFNWQRYIAAVTLSGPFLFTYALSNVIFLLLMIKPLGQKLLRLKEKYGM